MMENDNIGESIQKIINDPEGMAKIQALAQSLFSENTPAQNDAVPTAEEISILQNAFSMLKNDKPDERARLLIALKPHLSAERQGRVDKALSLLRIAKLAPLLSKSDLLKF